MACHAKTGLKVGPRLWLERTGERVVIDLKSVGVLEMKFVAPMPEQIATTTTQIL